MSGKSTLKNFKTMLAEAKLPEATVPTCMRGDLVAEHEQLNEELELLEKKAVGSLAGNGGAELAERITELEEQMRDSTYPIRVRALSKHRGPKSDPNRPTFPEFKAQYPLRLDAEGNVDERDQRFGFNSDDGFNQLVRVSIVDPEMDDDEFFDLMSKLTESQFDSLAAKAWLLNKGEIDVPFSRAASRLNRLSADASKPPTD